MIGFLAIAETLVQSGFTSDLHIRVRVCSAIYATPKALECCRMPDSAALPFNGPVPWLHIFRCTPLWTSCTRLEIKEIEFSGVLLTFFWRGVKPHSFFDITEVFPVGGESGAQVSSPQSGSGWKSPVPTIKYATQACEAERLDASTAVLAFSRTAILLKLRAAALVPEDGSSWETLQGSQAHAATMRTQVFVNVEDGGFRQSG